MFKLILFVLVIFSFFSIAQNIDEQVFDVRAQLTGSSDDSKITPQTFPTEVIGQENNATDPKPQLIKLNIHGWEFPLAIFIIFIITVVLYWAIKRAIKDNVQSSKDTNSGNGDEIYKGGFWDIIREGDYYPSLARFQFLLWTFVIAFTLLSSFIILIENNLIDRELDLPINTLILMGISTGVPIVSNIISAQNYTKTLPGIPKKKDVPKFSTMLLEHDKPTLGRYQMLLWTFLSISIYLFQFSHTMDQELVISTELTIIPDVKDSLVILMGLSQAGYLGFKSVARKREFILESHTPNDGQIVDKNTDITASFNKDVDELTIDQNTIILKKDGSEDPIPGTITIDPNKKTIIFKPKLPLEGSFTYNVTVSKNIKDTEEVNLKSDVSWSFETNE